MNDDFSPPPPSGEPLRQDHPAPQEAAPQSQESVNGTQGPSTGLSGAAAEQEPAIDSESDQAVETTPQEEVMSEESLSDPSPKAPAEVLQPPVGEPTSMGGAFVPPPVGMPVSQGAQPTPTINDSADVPLQPAPAADMPMPASEPTQATPIAGMPAPAPTQPVPVAGMPAPAPTQPVPVAGMPVAPGAQPYAPASSPGNPAEQPYGAGQATGVPFSQGASKPKRSKKPLIITLAAVGAVVIIIAGILIFQEVSRAGAYEHAEMYFLDGEYELAQDAFLELGDYRDSAERATIAGEFADYEYAMSLYEKGDFENARHQFVLLLDSQNIHDIGDWIDSCDYAIGKEYYDAGDYVNARTQFILLTGNSRFSDIDELINSCDYALAEALLNEGDIEAAYYAFLDLGDYSDAAARATACTQPFPATGVLYQDPGFNYEYCAIDIDYRFTSGASYYKIYSGDTLVATLFLNASSTARVHLKPGNYVVKEGSGDIWFGEALAFGRAGWYSTMLYDDSGTDYLTLNDGDLITITINAGTAGNVSERDEDLSSF